MIKYDNNYYKKLINRYEYDDIDAFLNISKISAKNKWLCSYNLNSFITGYKNNEQCLIIMGIGINGVPHMGTVSQILKAIYLQKMGFDVEIILGDLDVYGARSKTMKEISEIITKYRNFIISMGFDVSKGILRNQYDYDDIIKTSFLLSSVINDNDFNEIEEEINQLYKDKKVYKGMDFSVKQSISLMFADFIHPGFFQKYKHVLIMSGIDEHGYVWKANEIKNRMKIDMSISGLYSKMLKGLKDYPKMSKSLLDSTLNLEISKKDLSEIILSEKDNYNNSDDSFVYQLILNVSLYDDKYLEEIKHNCNLKNKLWDENKKMYINDLYNICKKWK